MRAVSFPGVPSQLLQNGLSLILFCIQIASGVLPAAGVWTNGTFDENDFEKAALDGPDVLKKINEMRISRATYRATDEKHIVANAHDFYGAFDCGIGNKDLDSRTIASSDLAAVSLVAIQELTRIIENQQKEIDQLKAEIEGLKRN